MRALRTRIAIPLALLPLAACATTPPGASAAQAGSSAATAATCATDNGGITLPAGFCATVFADSLPGPRHAVVAANGDLLVALRGANVGGVATPGGVVLLRDADRDGRAEVRRKTGSFAATGIALRDGHVFTENGAAILRYRWPAGALEPSGAADTVVGGLPTGGHSSKSMVFGRDGALYVNMGSRTNACQERDRQAGSRGVDPCTELETRAGIWRFDVSRLGQRQSDGVRFATGIRNTVALDVHPRDGALWVMQHGRDQLFQNWPALYDSVQSAESPAEELFRVERGDDFGWPYCYVDTRTGRRVLAPEYGGDGRTEGRCARTKRAVALFPAHWAPNGMLFYTGTQFPARFRDGVFVAFHGSWNRHPLPQAGFNVVFQPMRGAAAAGAHEVFADGFVSPEVKAAPRANQAQGARERYRPTGLAQGPDGALYITDDSMGRIWRVTYTGTTR